MKIVIITSSFPRRKGDFQGTFIYHQALGQVRLGNEVHVVCPHFPGLAFEETTDGIFVHRFAYFFPYRLQRLSAETGMYLSLSASLLSWAQLPLYVFFEWYATNRVISRYGIDIIHSHWIVPQGIAGMFCNVTRHKPHIVSSHVADAQVFARFHLIRPLLRSILKRTDFLTTNSSYTKNVIGSLLAIPCSCEVIPMGVDIRQRFENPPDAGSSPRILFVGRLIEWKGVDTLIRAMVTVVKARPDARLVIAGTGGERQNLEKLAADLGISDHVEFFGKVSDDQLVDLYRRTSVLVLPSRPSRGIIMEGLGVVLLEAMSHGVPVIGSNTGGIPDIITDGVNGFLVPCDNDTVLSGRILTLLNDPVLAGRFRQNGYETVEERFSWERISLEFSHLYSRVVGS